MLLQLTEHLRFQGWQMRLGNGQSVTAWWKGPGVGAERAKLLWPDAAAALQDRDAKNVPTSHSPAVLMPATTRRDAGDAAATAGGVRPAGWWGVVRAAAARRDAPSSDDGPLYAMQPVVARSSASISENAKTRSCDRRASETSTQPAPRPSAAGREGGFTAPCMLTVLGQLAAAAAALPRCKVVTWRCTNWAAFHGLSSIFTMHALHGVVTARREPALPRGTGCWGYHGLWQWGHVDLPLLLNHLYRQPPWKRLRQVRQLQAAQHRTQWLG